MRRRSRDCDPLPELEEDHEDLSTVDMDVPLYWYEGECPGCGQFLPLTERGLCSDCDGRFDRDLVRLRHWDSSSLTEGVPAEDRETVRQQVVDQHGTALELLTLRIGDSEDGDSEGGEEE